jgi:hypothetical protein
MNVSQSRALHLTFSSNEVSLTPRRRFKQWLLTYMTVWCNQSGGSAIGSLGADTAISNVIYRNVYTNGGNQIMMVSDS